MKRIIGIVVTCVVVMLFLLNNKKAYAANNSEGVIYDIGVVNDMKTSDDSDRVLLNGKEIDVNSLLSFDSREEAMTFFNKLERSATVNTKNDLSHLKKGMVSINSTSGNTCVDKQNEGLATISLCVSYTTTGPNHGSIISYGAYTTFTGFTNSLGWEERYCSARVSASGKDIIAEASGELMVYFLIENFIEMYRKPINLSGICTAVR